MKFRDPDTPAILAPPPLLFFACLLAAWGLGFVRRFEPVDLPVSARIAAGSCLVLAGFALGLSALVVMHRAGTSAEPWKPTARIVSAGPFSVTRNPIYLSLCLVLASFAGFTASAWFLVFVPVLVAILDLGVIRAEERYLTARFGEEYVAYTHRVRRWI